MTFAEFIGRRRLRLGLTVRAAAKIIGVDHSRVVRWESGKDQPPKDAVRLHAIAAAYAVEGEDVSTLQDYLTALVLGERLGTMPWRPATPEA